ncbi:hypothetical protein PMI07_003049 [Rhizobium sp. CF080]|nr:hypothetical protein PMI07_003049 [Rhizobium sp. CF080]
MVLLWNAATVIAAFVITFFISNGLRLIGNFSANLKTLRAYKFDE